MFQETLKFAKQVPRLMESYVVATWADGVLPFVQQGAEEQPLRGLKQLVKQMLKN